ncbi:MAG: DUF2029 domain-containing protein [Anaerolineae bacterium]|nr:DUF2029 domain-containing protein [Anaerolineae bacterium]
MYDGHLTANLLNNKGLIYIEGYNYIYHPLIAIFLSPITTLLTANQTGIFWYLTNLIAFITTIYLIVKALHHNQAYSFRNYLVMGLIFIPTAYSFFVGQINPLVMLCVVLSLHNTIHSKVRLAGFFWGISIILKIMPILFILYFIATKKLTIILYGLLTIIILNFITILFFPDAFLNFIHILLMGSNQLNPHPANQSLGAFLARILTTNSYSYPLLNAKELAQMIHYGMIAIGIISTFAILYQYANKTKFSSLLGFNIIFILVVLISPLSWENFYVLLVIPFVSLISYWQHLTRPMRWAIIVAIGLIITQRGWALYGSDPELFLWLKSYTLLMSLGFYGAFILYIVNIALLIQGYNIHDTTHSSRQRD